MATQPDEKRVTSVRLTAEERQQLDAIARAAGLSRGRQIAAWIRRHEEESASCTAT